MHPATSKTDNSMKRVSTNTPAIMQIMEYSIIKVHTPVINKIVGVPLNHDFSLRFISSYFEHFGQHSKQKIV